jgi:hypothetical protein
LEVGKVRLEEVDGGLWILTCRWLMAVALTIARQMFSAPQSFAANSIAAKCLMTGSVYEGFFRVAKPLHFSIST